MHTAVLVPGFVDMGISMAGMPTTMKAPTGVTMNLEVN
jgi:hypothetical protein